MNIGELKHRIRFEKNQKISDGQGGFDSNWVELDKLWAKAVEQSPRSAYRGEEQHTQGFIFTIRQNQAITIPATRDSSNLRIVHRGGYTETIYLYKTKNTFKGTMDALTGKTDVQLAWLKLTCPSTGQQYMIPSFPSFKTASEAARHHRPQGIPTDLPYLWQSAS